MRRIMLVTALLALCALALPATAQDAPNIVSFNGISFSYPSSLGSDLTVNQIPGEDPAMEVPGGPQPARTQFSILGPISPAVQAAMTMPAPSVILTVIPAASFNMYPRAQESLNALTDLLASRPDLNTVDPLPILPDFGPQAVRARAEYLDFGDISGVAYLTAIKFDASPVLARDLQFVFFGVSTSGTVVTLTAPVTTTLLPAELAADFNMDAFTANINAEFAATAQTLIAGAPGDFSPSLDDLFAVVRSVSVSAVMPGMPPQTSDLPPTAEPTPDVTVNTDPTLGGLAGGWTLVSFGAADAQMMPSEGVPVTIEFSADGVFGTDGCNSYRGTFTYDNTALAFTPLVGTLMACPEPVMQVADAYLTALNTVTAFAVDGETLMLIYDGGTLMFTKSVPPTTP